jgi:hypothetical protein
MAIDRFVKYSAQARPPQAPSAPYHLRAEGSLHNDQNNPIAVLRCAIFIMEIVTFHYHLFIEMTTGITE